MRKYIPSLTGLRFIAALMVLITHVIFQTTTNSHSLLVRLTGRLDYAVAIFFTLSGFLLWRKHVLTTPTTSLETWWKDYYLTRFFRILPAYLLVVIIVLGFFPGHHHTSKTIWLANLSLTQNLVPYSLVADLTQMWSLAVEMQFYLLLPLLGILIQRLSKLKSVSLTRQQILISFILLSCLWEWLAKLLPIAENQNTQIWVFGFFPWFLAGALLAEIEKSANPPKIFQNTPLCYSLAFLAYLLAITPLAGPGGLNPLTSMQFITKIALGTIFALGTVAPLILTPTSTKWSNLLTTPHFQQLGNWSYSFFLWHLAILSLVLDLLDLNIFHGRTLLVLILTALLTLPLAANSYHYIELPFLRLAKKLTAPQPKPTKRQHRYVK